MKCSCGAQNPGFATKCLRCGAVLKGTSPVVGSRQAVQQPSEVKAQSAAMVSSVATASTAHSYTMDLAPWLALFSALALVYWLEPVRPEAVLTEPPPPAVNIAADLVVMQDESGDMAIFDNVFELLKRLGWEKRVKTVPLKRLAEPDILDVEVQQGGLNGARILFIGCCTLPKSWPSKPIGPGDRDTISVSLDERIENQVTDNLTQFLRRGGTLYASDWACWYVANILQRNGTVYDLSTGPAQEVEAQVVHVDFQTALGSSLPLSFDKSGWRTIYPRNDQKGAIILKARVRTRESLGYESTHDLPLAFTIPYGDGRVFFTAFHNEKNTEVGEKFLRTVCSFIDLPESTEGRTILIGQLAIPTIVGGSGESSLECSVDLPAVRSAVFYIQFNPGGAKLKCSIVTPTGKTIASANTDPFEVTISDVAKGTYTCRIEALQLPYNGFPVRITVHY